MDMTWGKAIRQQRQALGITQRQVADMCGVEKQTVWAWEKGVIEPSAAHGRTLVRRLGIDPITLHRIFTTDREPAA